MALVTLVTALIGTAPAEADFVFGARIGDSFVVGGSDGVRAEINLGSKRHRYGHHHHKRERSRPLLGKPGQLHSRIGLGRERREEIREYRRRKLFLLPIRERTLVEREPPPVEPRPKPARPKKPEAVVDKALPNPAGDARLVRARGTRLDPAITIGTVLPTRLPHVTLDPVRFNLPSAPPGQIYARVRGQVYLIDQTTRLVRDRIEPQG